MQECDITSTIAEHDFHVDSPQVEPLKRPRRSRWACFQVSASGVTHRWVDVAGLSVHVAEAGAGPPLLLLHAWPQHWFCWRRVVPLSDRYRLIMPDLRGHGRSGAPRRGYEKEQLATDLLTLLDTLELDKVGLVGHDWGGWTGFWPVFGHRSASGPSSRWASSTRSSERRWPRRRNHGVAAISSL